MGSRNGVRPFVIHYGAISSGLTPRGSGEPSPSRAARRHGERQRSADRDAVRLRHLAWHRLSIVVITAPRDESLDESETGT